MVDVYNRAESYDRLRERIDEWPISEENRLHIKRYVRNEIDRKSPGRRCSDLWLLRKLFVGTTRGKLICPPLVSKSLSEFTIEDFQVVRERVNRELTSKDTYEKLSAHLRNVYEEAFSEDLDRERILHVLFRTGRRRFFRWRSDTPTSDSIEQSRYYTFDEFQRLLSVAQRPKERALLALAWEGTPRPNEYLSATVGDVEELEQGFRVRVHISKKRGVTQYRYAYILLLRADFNSYWRAHAFRNDPKAALFYREDNQRDFGKPMTPNGANKMLKKLDRLSGVNKNGTLYFLRHGGYTWKRLQGMNPALAGKDMGWSPGGKEERRYLHLTEEEVMAERFRLVDQLPVKLAEPPKTPICPFCNAANSPVDDHCIQCGDPLNVKNVYG